VNSKVENSFGIPKEEFIGKNHSITKAINLTDSDYKELWKTIKSGSIWNGIMEFDNLSGKLYNSVNIYPISKKDGSIEEYVSIRDDITEIIQLKNDIDEAQNEIIFTLGAIVESKDGELKEHIERVSEYSYVLAKAYGLPKDICKKIKHAAPLHDIGKIGVSESILNAPRKLSEIENIEMKQHPLIGYRILKDSKLETLQIAGDIALEHHEKWDGTGYPKGLKGEEISIYARIVALADVFDALASERPYKQAWSISKIEQLLINEKGKQFDPYLIDLFFENKEEIYKIKSRLK